MFLEGMQYFYAPVVTLFIFIIFILKNQLLKKWIKRFFLMETVVILTVEIATWADLYFRVSGNEISYKLRLMTTFIQFALGPCSPAILLAIYYNKMKKLHFKCALVLPLVINMILCIISLHNGCIFHVTKDNTYSRGNLFVFPIGISLFYVCLLLIYSAKQTKRDKREETLLLLCSTIAVTGASILEVKYQIHYVIWNTAQTCVILYFLMLNIQKVIYEPLTGAYSRVAYSTKLEKINNKHASVFAMIDINNLKLVNDRQGHDRGDELITMIATSIIKSAGRKMKLYRIGGDEFVLIMEGNSPSAVHYSLAAAQKSCVSKLGQGQGFAYGIVTYEPGQNLHEVLREADQKMYELKSTMKVCSENSK